VGTADRQHGLRHLTPRSAGDKIIETLDADEPPAADPTLLLQKMENRLVRHHLRLPDVLSGAQVRQLRYILNFARLADFEPGAAGPRGTRGRGDVSVAGLKQTLHAAHESLVRFEPTLSPANLAPSVESIDRACEWGRNSVDEAIPLTSALLEPTWWEGDGPAIPSAEPTVKSVASPMSAVMAAIQLPRTRLARWRSRHLT
jgi:hypothetical protein